MFLPNWVGDVVMATPALRALRRCMGEARITYVGRPGSLETLRGTDWNDAAVVDETPDRRPLVAMARLVGAVRRGRHDLGILLPNSFRVAAIARLAGIKRIAGYDRDGRGLLLTDRITPFRDEDRRFVPVPTMDYYLNLVRMFGVRCDFAQPALAVPEDDARAAGDLMAGAVDPTRPVVMLNPGASFGPSKMWSPRRFAAAADELICRGAQIIIHAAPGEKDIARSVAAAMTEAPAINMADHEGTIGTLKGLMRACSVLITNDTGARHVAAAFGIGVVTIFGSTDPRWSELNYGNERILRVDLPCSPCQRRICGQPAGPLYHKCMEDITVEMVVSATEALLKIYAPAGSGG